MSKNLQLRKKQNRQNVADNLPDPDAAPASGKKAKKKTGKAKKTRGSKK